MHSGFLITSLDKHVPEFKLQMTGTSPSTYLLWNEKTQIYIFFCIFLLTSVSRAWFNPVDPPNLLFIERRVARATSCPRGAIWQMAPQITMVSHFELQKVWLSIIEVDSWWYWCLCSYFLVHLVFYVFLPPNNETWILQQQLFTVVSPNRWSNQSESDHWWRKFHVATPPERVRIRQSLMAESMMCPALRANHLCHGHPIFNRNPYNGYINPYYWVDFPIP